MLHHCSVSWKITPQTFIVWTKRAHRGEIFGILSGWVKIHQILYAIFESTSQIFFKFCISLQCHEIYLFRTFLVETAHDLDKMSPSECKISDFLSTAHIKFKI